MLIGGWCSDVCSSDLLRDDYLAEGYSEEDTAEFDSIETVEAIAGELAARGFAVDRIGHVRRLTERLATGARWEFVFKIAAGRNGAGREAEEEGRAGGRGREGATVEVAGGKGGK